MDVPLLRRRLLAWYRRAQRDLPWRRPGMGVYGVWVSEAMLQQTRVDVATPYWTRWMERFPTAQALAAASAEDVLRAWAGLGYYSRARNLHAAAKLVARDGWPKSAATWRDLPGVGPYTAAAVASIAQGEPVACVDGNVVRVVARLAGERGDVGTRSVRGRIDALAQEWLAHRAPGDWNQAMMELGATVCTSRAPRCDDCPVAALCAARAAGDAASLPRKRAAKQARMERRAVAVVEDEAGRVLFLRQPDGLLAGLWGLPAAARGDALAAEVRRAAGVDIVLAGRPRTAIHRFSHRTWHMSVRRGRVVAVPGGGTGEARWIGRAELAGEAVPAAAHVALAAAGIGAEPAKAKTAPASGRP